MAPSETLKRFIDDIDGPKLFGQPQQGPNLQLSPATTILSDPRLSPKTRPVLSRSVPSQQSSSPSTSPVSSILSRRDSDSSNTSTAPTDRTHSLDGSLATMSIGGRNRHLPCILKEIIGCPITFRLSERPEWYLHSLSHYGGKSPPSHALCIFCNTVFDSSDPATCWSERMDHIADHFENNWTIERSRPDFRVIKDMRNKGCISESDYRHCFEYTERPPCDGLRPHDYIPEKFKNKQRAAHEQANRIVVKESRQETRDRARGKRPLGPKKSGSKPKSMVK